MLSISPPPSSIPVNWWQELVLDVAQVDRLSAIRLSGPPPVFSRLINHYLFLLTSPEPRLIDLPQASRFLYHSGEELNLRSIFFSLPSIQFASHTTMSSPQQRLSSISNQLSGSSAASSREKLLTKNPDDVVCQALLLPPFSSCMANVTAIR